MQVNSTFRDFVVTSPLAQHRIELFAAGLEYNTGAGISLADSRKALSQYRSNLDSLCLTEEREVENLRRDRLGSPKIAGGVCAIMKDDSVSLFSLGSASRGIPYGEWEVPLPPIEPRDYDFYPGIDVIAFVAGLQEPRCVHSQWQSIF